MVSYFGRKCYKRINLRVLVRMNEMKLFKYILVNLIFVYECWNGLLCYFYKCGVGNVFFF